MLLEKIYSSTYLDDFPKDNERSIDMSDFDNVEKINPDQVEEIPPTPVAPESPKPNFTEAEGGNTSQTSQTSQTYAYAVTDEDENTAKILGIISLVTGILGLLCCCSGWFGIILSIAGVVCGIISIKKGESAKGMAIAGIACGGIGIILSLAMLLIAGIAGLAANALDGLGLDLDNIPGL